MDRGELLIGLLSQRQGVHVTSQQYHRSWPAASQDGRHRGGAAAGGDLQSQVRQLCEHRLPGLGKAQADFGDAMQFSAQGGQLGCHRRCRTSQTHGSLRSVTGSPNLSKPGPRRSPVTTDIPSTITDLLACCDGEASMA